MLERKVTTEIVDKTKILYYKLNNLISENYDPCDRRFEVNMVYDMITIEYHDRESFVPLCHIIVKENVVDLLVYFEGMTRYEPPAKDVLFFNDLLNSILYNYECTLSFENYDTLEEENEEDNEDEEEDF